MFGGARKLNSLMDSMLVLGKTFSGMAMTNETILTAGGETFRPPLSFGAQAQHHFFDDS